MAGVIIGMLFRSVVVAFKPVDIVAFAKLVAVVMFVSTVGMSVALIVGLAMRLPAALFEV